MSFISNPQKTPKDRCLFAIGMALAFIGLVIPAFTFPDWVTKGGSSLVNVFTAAKLLNQPGTAYNATFIVVLWLCSVAGIAAFLFTSSVVYEVLIWIVGAGFGIAATITLPAYLEVAPVVGYSAVGAYLVLVGWTVALVAWIVGAANVKHAGIRKEI